MTGKTKVLISTDIGIDVDDELAVYILLNNAQVEVKGIYTVSGDVESKSQIAKRIVELSGKSSNVIKGDSEPLGKGSGITGLNIEHCLYTKKFQIADNGHEDMAEKLKTEKYTILSIAPLTTIAKLITNFPDACRNIERIYVMGARINGNFSQFEHNISYDPEAANIVFRSGINITLVPADLCKNYKLPIEFTNNLKTKCGKYLRKLIRSHIASRIAIEFAYYNLNDVFHIDLSNPFVAAREPEIYLRRYNRLIQLSQDEITRTLLENIMPKKLAINDVYAVYSLLNPDKVQSENKTVTFGDLGETIVEEGLKHKIVTVIDDKQFKDFLIKELHC